MSIAPKSRMQRRFRWLTDFAKYTQRNVRGALALCALVILVNGCAITVEEEYPSIRPEPIYDELYPHYAAICAVSQIRAKFAEEGGTPGHAVMYLRGACKDETSPYPRIKLCPPEKVKGGDRATGVGVSVNKVFRNVNWMLVEGRSMFMDGTLQPGEVLDEQRAQQTLNAAEEANLFKGIEIHDEFMPATETQEEWQFLMAKETLGTDFALRFGRHIYCAAMPMPRERLGMVIDYLNALNDEYARGEADYNWSGYSDNCAHALHNSLAAADVWKPQSVRATKFKQLFNLAVPANEMTNLAFRGNTYPLEDFGKIYRDKSLRRALLDHGWLPTRHGALIAYLPVHKPNELYDTTETIFVLEAPIFRGRSNKVNKMIQEPKYTRVLDNLLYWETRYENILAKRPKGWDTPAEGNARQQARKRYYEYIEAQLDDVRQLLKRASAASPSATQTQ